MAVPFEEGDGGGVRDVEGAGWTRDWNVNYRITLLEYFIANAVTLVAYDESYINWKFGFIDISRVRCSFDGDYFFICRDEFVEIGFFGEVPFYVVFARSGAFPHPS